MFGGWTMPAYFFRSEPGAAELRRLARGESGRVCQRVLMIANLLEEMEHEEAPRLAGLSRSAAYEWHNRYEEDGIAGLRDRPRPGRQPRVNAVTSARYLPAAASDQVELVGAAAAPPGGRRDSASGVFATVGLQLERVRAAQPPGARVEIWFQDETRIGQKNSLTRVWGQTDSRPAAPKDLGFASAYLFGAVCPLQGKAAALIMPICNTAAMNHHLCEISSQVAAPRFREGRLCPCRGDPRWCRLAPQSRARGAQQYHLIGTAALQPGAQPSRADLALSAQPLARQFGVCQPDRHHGCLRDGMEPVRHTLLHGSAAKRSQPRAPTVYGRRTYSGRPSSSMRFSDATAMATSVVCRPSVRERSASPITRL